MPQEDMPSLLVRGLLRQERTAMHSAIWPTPKQTMQRLWAQELLPRAHSVRQSGLRLELAAKELLAWVFQLGPSDDTAAHSGRARKLRATIAMRLDTALMQLDWIAR